MRQIIPLIAAIITTMEHPITIGITSLEYQALRAACESLPPANGNYRITDFVQNLLLTVIDFQLRTVTVERAMEYFLAHVKHEAVDLNGLKSILTRFPDDKSGNLALAQFLWGYRYWNRASKLRRLVEFFEGEGVVDQPSLEQWATNATFGSFAGRVKGLGYAVFNWLIMRQGVDTVKPDVHVMRFANNAMGRKVKVDVVVAAPIQAATDLAMPVHKLDWAIWGRGSS